MTEDRSIIFGIPDKVEGNTYNAGEAKGTYHKSRQSLKAMQTLSFQFMVKRGMKKVMGVDIQLG